MTDLSRFPLIEAVGLIDAEDALSGLLALFREDKPTQRESDAMSRVLKVAEGQS